MYFSPFFLYICPVTKPKNTMSVYKEGFYAVDLITKASRQIWNDSADFGAPTKKGDNIWAWTKQLVEWYGVEGTKKVERYSTGTSVSQTVELMDEWNTGKTIRYSVNFVTVSNNPNMDGIVYLVRTK